MARMAAAREYKKKSQSPRTATSGHPAPPLPTAQTKEPKEQDTVLAALDAYATRQAQDEAADFLQAQQQIEASRPLPPSSPENSKNEGIGNSDNRGFRRGAGGTANQAATWLQTASSSSSQVDSTLSAEQFTLRKEELQRERGADIERAKGTIVGTRRRFDTPSDGEYGLAQQQDEAEAAMAKERAEIAAAKAAKAAAEIATLEQKNASDVEVKDGKEDDEHKPAVATWGVFPRPKNISEAYGGGRNLNPGQALETEDQAAERQKRVSAALSEYKKSMGLEIDPAVEAQAVKLYEQGEILFKDGRITEALKIFSEAAAMVPLKTKIGGQAYLQKAICLDSLGMNDEAYQIYNSLKGHNGPGVAKAARRFLFGWKAAKELKVEMRYDTGGSQAWSTYFEKFNSGNWAEYRAKQEESVEDEESAKYAARVATAVMLIPLALIASAIYLR